MKAYPFQLKRFLKIKVASALCFICMFTFCMSETVNAQESPEIEESVQEFFIGETVYAQEKYEVQFTLKPSYWKENGRAMVNIPLQFEYGITDRFQIELKLPYYFQRPGIDPGISGIGNGEVGFLYNILNKNRPFALSLALDIGLPSATKNKAIDDTEVEWEPSIIVAKQIGRAQVHAGLTAEITKSESASFNYNLATVFAFGNWRPMLELNGEIRNWENIYLTPGLVWKGLDDFEFGMGVSKSITKSEPGLGIILMATYEFSLQKRNNQK